ncbi:undecaprenyl-phosphate glucose phosphotransferase [Alicyclobacillus suci]|uniref:undecaprenyl-phosphate glucose phosphotransferase n=1 Tax=Alicyclobacillus suci TaxID=2816080 RepID=UPI001A8D763E|nr:undecaprenyl-phosphate glucose phosphotransferase [Alicyclobacillus suci]
MFRTYQVFWNRLFQLIDAIIVVGSFLLAWEIKFHSGLLGYGRHLSLTSYLSVIIVAVPLFLVSNWIAGLYKPMRSRTFWQESIAVLRSVVIGLLTFMSLLYVAHMGQFSRAVLVLFGILFSLFTYMVHIGILTLLRTMRSRGFNKKFVVIVGWTPAIRRLVKTLEYQPWFGYRILGFLSEREVYADGIPKLGRIQDLQNVIQQNLIDHVIISLPKAEERLIPDVIGTCEEYGVQSLIVPDYFELLPAKPRFESFAGMPLIDTRYVPLDDAVNAVLKRAFDIVFSAMVLVLLSPVYLVIAIAVRRSSQGPIIFRQTRVGKNRRLFTMYKFRTMYYTGNNSSEEDTEWTTPSDPRRTAIGAFLRRTSLDELPQFWNVLRGDMSVIGPRPERPQFVNDFKTRIPRYMVKHRVRPGITGLAQVNGWRGDTSIDERIRCDIDYIENWSFGMDMRIVWKTIKEGFVHENAY